MAEIRIETIRVSDIVSFSQKVINEKSNYKIVPITVKRARAQEKNPDAQPDDVALIVAYKDNECVGYLGNLPCKNERNGKTHAIYALSTFFVDDSMRGTGIAKKIMEEMVSHKRDLLLAGFTPVAEAFYRKNKQWFVPVEPLPYIRVHVNPIGSGLWYIKGKQSEKNRANICQDAFYFRELIRMDYKRKNAILCATAAIEAQK